VGNSSHGGGGTEQTASDSRRTVSSWRQANLHESASDSTLASGTVHSVAFDVIWTMPSARLSKHSRPWISTRREGERCLPDSTRGLVQLARAADRRSGELLGSDAVCLVATMRPPGPLCARMILTRLSHRYTPLLLQTLRK